jgi:hypothetical protein
MPLFVSINPVLFSYKTNIPIPDNPIAACEYVAQWHLPLQRGESGSEVSRVGTCICTCYQPGYSARQWRTTFKNVDDLLNTRGVDGFDRLQQESVWFYFGPRVQLIVQFGLSRELRGVFTSVMIRTVLKRRIPTESVGPMMTFLF